MNFVTVNRISQAVNRAFARCGGNGKLLTANASYSVNYTMPNDTRVGPNRSDLMNVTYKLKFGAYGIPKPTTNDHFQLQNGNIHVITQVEATDLASTDVMFEITIKGQES